jgi:hypothetical protein
MLLVANTGTRRGTVRTCHMCQKNKARNSFQGFSNHWNSRKPRGNVSMGFITQHPVTKRGHDAIYVVVDKLTKLVHIIPTHTSAMLVKQHCYTMKTYENSMEFPRKLSLTEAHSLSVHSLRHCASRSEQSKLCPRRTTRRQTGKPKE